MNAVRVQRAACEVQLLLIPRVCVDDLSAGVDVDFAWNAGDLALCVFGQYLKAQTTPGRKHMEHRNKKTRGQTNTPIHNHAI